MLHSILLGLSSIIILGIGAEWLAWRFRLPSIVVLLVFGFIAGPVTGLLNPDALFGDLLVPIVSISVAIILFEGGTNLRISELRAIGTVLRNLITVGIFVSWLISSAAAYFIFGLDLRLAILLGAILVSTGTTVIVPLLRHLQLGGQVGSILKWEGIVTDPIGALLAVLVFGIIITGGNEPLTALVGTDLLIFVLAGGIIGIAGAAVLALLLRSFWIPDFLCSPVTLAMVIAAFAASNTIQAESGLLAATVMGIALANQKMVSIWRIVEFKENLRVLLISGLFILLAARLQLSSLSHIGINGLLFVAVLIVLARPISVLLSTVGTKMNWRGRVFLFCLAPRGIVAAAVASVFALRLVEAGYPQAELLVPLTFVVIASTVVVYGLSSAPIARRLNIADPNPQGVLIVGAHSWARAIASSLQSEGYRVLVVDANWANISTARMAGLPTFYANILSQYATDEIDLSGIGHLLALTYDNEFNSLVVLQFANIFDRSETYQLVSEKVQKNGKETVSEHLHGRLLFDPEMTYPELNRRFLEGAVVKTTQLTEEFDYNAFQRRYNGMAVPLFLVDKNGNLKVFTVDNPPKPQPGQKLISIIKSAEGD